MVGRCTVARVLLLLLLPPVLLLLKPLCCASNKTSAAEHGALSACATAGQGTLFAGRHCHRALPCRPVRPPLPCPLLTPPSTPAEPTSGLDSASAFYVMSSVKQLAEHCRTVVAVIHQPSSEVGGGGASRRRGWRDGCCDGSIKGQHCSQGARASALTAAQEGLQHKHSTGHQTKHPTKGCLDPACWPPCRCSTCLTSCACCRTATWCTLATPTSAWTCLRARGCRCPACATPPTTSS